MLDEDTSEKIKSYLAKPVALHLDCLLQRFRTLCHLLLNFIIQVLFVSLRPS